MPNSDGRFDDPAAARTISRLAALIFLLALALRVAYILRLDNSSMGTWGDQGGDIALSLLHGRGYIASSGICHDFRSFRMPLFPLTLFCIWSILGPNILAAKLIMAVVSSATCMVLARLGQALFTARAGILAALGAAVLPEFIRWTGTLGAETLAIFLTTLSILLLVKRPVYHGWIPAGLAVGLMALTRPVLLPMIIFIPALYLLTRGPAWRRPCRNFAITVMLVLSPWVVRNYLVHHTLMVTSTEGGVTFLETNNPEAWYRHGSNWVPGYAATLPSIAEAARRLPEAEIDHAMYRQGLRFVLRDPAAYLRACFLRITYLWRPVPNLTGDLSRLHIYLLALIWTPVLALALWSILHGRLWRDEQHWPVLLIFACLSLAAGLVCGQNRYRAPAEPCLLLYAAYPVTEWLRKVTGDR